MKKLLALSVLFIFVFATSIEAQPKIGDEAKEIVLKNMNGATERLSDYRGKIVLVDFWASWCAPCRVSNHELKPLYTKYKNKGFEIFGISIDKKIEDWKKAIYADRMTWKQVSAPDGWETPVALEWAIEEIPTSFLLDKEGKIIAINPSREKIEEYLINSKF